jgi:hypothetical protein
MALWQQASIIVSSWMHSLMVDGLMKASPLLWITEGRIDQQLTQAHLLAHNFDSCATNTVRNSQEA